MNQPYFLLPSGARVTYQEVADQIRQAYPNLVGAHIFQQLQALGLLALFQQGTTPHSLPYSFSDYATPF